MFSVKKIEIQSHFNWIYFIFQEIENMKPVKVSKSHLKCMLNPKSIEDRILDLNDWLFYLLRLEWADVVEVNS